MNRSLLSLAIAGLTTAAGLAAPVGLAHAQSACYAFASEQYPDERFVIDVEPHSILVNPWYDLVALVLGGKQTAYSVHGKYVFAYQEVAANQEPVSPWFVEVAAATGTVDVSSRYLLPPPRANMQMTPTGAHLGLTVNLVRGDGVPAGTVSAVPFALDCGSEEISSLPNQWTCQSFNQFGLYYGVDTLIKVANPANDVRCNFFESIPAVVVEQTSISSQGHKSHATAN